MGHAYCLSGIVESKQPVQVRMVMNRWFLGSRYKTEYSKVSVSGGGNLDGEAVELTFFACRVKVDSFCQVVHCRLELDDES